MQDIIGEASRIVVEYGEFLEYGTTLQIKDSGKQPVMIKMKYDGFGTSFAPMPPEEHIIRAKDIAELVLKLNRKNILSLDTLTSIFTGAGDIMHHAVAAYAAFR